MYCRQDVTQTEAQFDVIIDTVGSLNYVVCRDRLNKGGRLVLAVAGLVEMFSAGRKNTHRVIVGAASGNVEDLQQLAELTTSGKFIPYIDRVYPYKQIQKAHQYVDTEHKKGNVVYPVSTNLGAGQTKGQ
jgi:NADPH:quinone reductase-like Zn-dependent oxidoreductase